MNLKYSALVTLKLFIFLCLFGWMPGISYAAEYQNCTTNGTCVIGEFLYDDNYAPNATASCSLTSRYPDGSVFINAATASATSNAWYSYTVSTGTIEGVYPSQICCTTDVDYLCLDKTFKVQATATTSAAGTSITAADVWNYPTRSVTTFGSLIADIWDYNSRSLTNFGNLISDIWSHKDRTLSSSTTATETKATLANIAEIKEIKKVVKENRVLLEQLINKPIVKTFIDEAPTQKLSEKIEQTKIATTDLYGNIQNLKSRSSILSEKWPSLSVEEIKSELSTLSNIFKQDSGKKDSNIISETNWLKSSWKGQIFLSFSDQVTAAQTKIDNLINDLNVYGKAESPDVFSPAISHIENLNSLIGTSLATASDPTLFGFVKRTNEKVQSLDKQSSEALKILTEIKADITKDFSEAIKLVSENTMALNEVPQVDSFFQKSIKKTDTPTNKLLGLMAIIDTNKLMLASTNGIAVKNIWMEEGSIIFRSVATNPSNTITQKVLVKYYLPTEIRKEQIIDHDRELTIDYDPIENALFATGEVSLAPQETRTFLVEVEDIWSFKQEEIDSVRNQVNALHESLKNTSHYTQSSAIKTDINVTLDKIMIRQNQAVTPENRIRTYRESSLEMNGVEEKIYSLKELLVQSGNKANLVNFLNNIEPFSLWGIVAIVIASFAFLIFYLNALRSEAHFVEVVEKEANEIEKHRELYHPNPNYRHRENNHHKLKHIAKIAVIALLTSSISSLGASLAIKTSKNYALASNTNSETATKVLGTSTEKTYPYMTNIKLPNSGAVPVRTGPSLSMPEIKSIKTVESIFVFRKSNGWSQIGLTHTDQDKGWWINNQYLEE